MIEDGRIEWTINNQQPAAAASSSRQSTCDMGFNDIATSQPNDISYWGPFPMLSRRNISTHR